MARVIITRAMGYQPSIRRRLIESALVDRLKRMPVVVLTGARQVGKTTLARSFRGAAARRFVDLDSLTTLDQARSQPEVIVEGDDPLTIDEVQRAPDLLIAIKRAVDRQPMRGRFLLTGSANLRLARSVAESLAGRAVHLVLRPMTEREKRNDPSPPAWPQLLRASTATAAMASLAVGPPWNWRRAALAGGLPPAALARNSTDRHVWFEGYIDTYVHRDLRDLAQVGDLGAFVRLVRLTALRTGGLLNQADLARDAGISPTTAQRWLSILDASFLITLLQPFAESRAKRLIKAPKLYALDTGLALHLAQVADESVLARQTHSGAWLENLVLNDLLAWRETEVRKPGIFYRRTASGEEIDFVIEHDRRLLPIEVKAARHLRTADARTLDAFCREFGRRAPFGLLLYDGDEIFLLTKAALAIPLRAVL
jgi:hypothetical protein